jgi:hypothetical protein
LGFIPHRAFESHCLRSAPLAQRIEHQTTDLAVGGSNPSRRAPTPQVNGLGLLALLIPLSVPCQSFALSNGPTGIGGPVIRQRGKSTQVMSTRDVTPSPAVSAGSVGRSPAPGEPPSKRPSRSRPSCSPRSPPAATRTPTLDRELPHCRSERSAMIVVSAATGQFDRLLETCARGRGHGGRR